MITQAIQSNESVAHAFSKLTRSDQLLIRKSRKNAMKAGVPVCHEWLHGNGILRGIECMYRDIGKRPTSSHKLMRRDKTKEHSGTNSFWSYPGLSTNGRPSVRLELSCGRNLSLVKASELSGLSPDTLGYRLKTMTLEQAMLTAKGCRASYPSDKAVEFFSKINLEDCTARLVQEEQQAHLSQFGKRGTQPTRNFRALSVLSSNDLMAKITYVLELDLSAHKKSAILAFLACPSNVRSGTHSVLKNVIRRCRDKNDPSYSHYGARGIDVCETWVSGLGELTGLHCFVLDVGPQQPCMELDRIDNDAGYNKLNCRWVTRKTNMKNQFRAEDIAARLNALVEQAVRIELEAREEKIDMNEFLKSIL